MNTRAPAAGDNEEQVLENEEELIALLLLITEESGKRFKEKLEQYHSRLVRMGVEAGKDVTGNKTELTEAEIATLITIVVTAQMEYADNWLNDVFSTTRNTVLRRSFTQDRFRTAIRQAAHSQQYRCNSFAKSSHATAHRGFWEEMIHQNELLKEGKMFRMEAIFTAYPEDDIIETSCEGCAGAVAGNPYEPENVPSPGDFECSFNCRHEIWYRVVPIGVDIGDEIV